MSMHENDFTYLVSSLTMTSPSLILACSSSAKMLKILAKYPVPGTISAKGGWNVSNFTRAVVTLSKRDVSDELLLRSWVASSSRSERNSRGFRRTHPGLAMKSRM